MHRIILNGNDCQGYGQWNNRIQGDFRYHPNNSEHHLFKVSVFVYIFFIHFDQLHPMKFREHRINGI